MPALRVEITLRRSNMSHIPRPRGFPLESPRFPWKKRAPAAEATRVADSHHAASELIRATMIPDPEGTMQRDQSGTGILSVKAIAQSSRAGPGGRAQLFPGGRITGFADALDASIPGSDLISQSDESLHSFHIIGQNPFRSDWPSVVCDRSKASPLRFHRRAGK